MVILTAALLSFLQSSREGPDGPYDSITVPVRPDGEKAVGPIWMPFDGQTSLALHDYRTVDPLKLLFYAAREQVAPWEGRIARRLILGAKACDIKALEVLDQALLEGEFVDPAYKSWRDATTVVSFDCGRAAPSCHCTSLGGKPFAESGFDVNASPAGDELWLAAGSDKGRRFLDFLRTRLGGSEATDGIRAAAAERRSAVAHQVEKQNREYSRDTGELRLEQASPLFWEEEAKDCVGCGACTNVCPSCYCLILNDATRSGPFVKVRSYDSCQWHGYARVAGGASPRPHVAERFRHRYLCKFVWMNGQFGRFGCTGCGRCTDACPSGIEFRAVVGRGREKLAPAAGFTAGPVPGRST